MTSSLDAYHPIDPDQSDLGLRIDVNGGRGWRAFRFPLLSVRQAPFQLKRLALTIVRLCDETHGRVMRFDQAESLQIAALRLLHGVPRRHEARWRAEAPRWSQERFFLVEVQDGPQAIDVRVAPIARADFSSAGSPSATASKGAFRATAKKVVITR